MTTSTPVRRDASDRTTGNGEKRGFYKDVPDANVSTTISTSPASAEIAQALGIEQGTPVLTRARVMAGDRGVLQLATTSFSPAVAAAIPQLAEQNTGPGGMYARLQEAGHDIVGNQTDLVSARPGTADEITQLGLTEGSWVIEIYRSTCNQSGTVLEFTHVVANPLLNQFEYKI